MKEKVCAISVDVDSIVDYANSYCISSYRYNSDNVIYEKAIPRFLELFEKYGINATFFVVGRDIANPNNHRLLKEMIRCGHEIGNHTMNHPYAFSSLSLRKKKEEIVSMHKLLEDITGYRARGFRAPGYNIDSETIDILEQEGYLYDSSVHPTIWDLFIRIMVFMVSIGKRKLYLNKMILRSFFSSITPFLPKVNAKIIEIPISVTPFLRLPFYGTLHQALPVFVQ